MAPVPLHGEFDVGRTTDGAPAFDLGLVAFFGIAFGIIPAPILPACAPFIILTVRSERR